MFKIMIQDAAAFCLPFLAYRTLLTAMRAQQMEVPAKINAEGAAAAALAHLRIQEFVGRLVDHGKTMLLSADRYLIQNFNSRGMN